MTVKQIAKRCAQIIEASSKLAKPRDIRDPTWFWWEPQGPPAVVDLLDRIKKLVWHSGRRRENQVRIIKRRAVELGIIEKGEP